MISIWVDSEEEAQQYLYHYTTIETLILYILPQMSLKFSSIKKTNDPEEIYDHGFTMEHDMNIEKKLEKELIDQFIPNQKKFADALSRDMKILCCTQDYIPEQIDFVRNTGRGFLKPRMWAQYSNNHKGVCLILDRKRIIEKFNNKFADQYHLSRSVIYEYNCEKIRESIEAYTLKTSELIANDIEKVVEKRKRKFEDIYYFSKHPDWRDENEYRFLIKDTSKDNPSIELDGILKGIIMGTQADELVYNAIHIMIQNFTNIPDIYKLVYFNNSYLLSPLLLDDEKNKK